MSQTVLVEKIGTNNVYSTKQHNSDSLVSGQLRCWTTPSCTGPQAKWDFVDQLSKFHEMPFLKTPAIDLYGSEQVFYAPMQQL